MPFRFLSGRDNQRLDTIEAKIQQMLATDRAELELALSALFGDVEEADVNGELRRMDQQVNQLERDIRRELLVHASVAGSIETPAVLVYMSIVKDIERIGDYAKNILDLAKYGARLGGAPNVEEWRQMSATIAEYLSDTAVTFERRDPDRARELLTRGGDLLGRLERGVAALVAGEAEGSDPVARALALRYIKRVVAHLMNVLSAVVMPVDRLDYFDEDPEDRV